MATNLLFQQRGYFSSFGLSLVLYLLFSLSASAQAPTISTQPNTVSVCPTVVPGGNVTYTVTATGTGLSYQWRKDGVNIAGATAASLTLTAVTTADVAAYTVLVSNVSGSVLSRPTFLGNYWVGGISSTYGDFLNWSCGFVPGVNDNANIPAGATNYPLITAARACRDLNIVPGATVTVGATGVLDISRNINNTGTFNAVQGSVRMVGTAAQTIPANAFSTNYVNNLAIINASGVTLGGPLNLTGVLLPQLGTFTTGGHLVFKSNVTTTAMVDVVTGAISGEVTVERYIPAKRAFRFLTSSVTSTGSIRANWQEGGSDAPGWGTDITGTGGAANGFDPSGSNNPSMFTLNHNNSTAGTWVAVTNTTSGVLTAGVPYRIMVRGDRTIDQHLNNATPTNTVMRAKGTLRTGNVVVTPSLNTAIGGYTLLGNPYQARLNMFDALAANSTGLNQQYYYVWDPTRNARGAYVTVDVITNLNSFAGSTANRLVPSGQAFYVRTIAANPTLTFVEVHKQVLNNATQPIFRNATTIPKIRFTLYEDSALALDNTSADGFVVTFDSSYSNDVDEYDALKMTNLDENMGLMNSGSLLSFESRNLPTASDILPISLTQYRNTNYTYKVEVDGISGVTAYLVDKYANTRTALENDATTSVSFQVDPAIAESSMANRFDVVFESALGTEETAFAKGIRVYPNPVTDNQFFVTLPEATEGKLVLKIANLLGQEVYSEELNVSEKTIKIQPATALQSGIYLVRVSNGNETTAKKIIVK